MSVYDIVMLIIFLGAVWFGFRKGLAWQIASLLSIVLSYFVAVNFRNPVAALISAQEPWNQFAAMLILFLGTSLVVWTVFASFSRNIKKMNLGGFDRQAGAILGAFKGAILCMLATVFAVSLFQPTRDMVHNSKAGHYVVSGIRQFARFTPDELAPYLDHHIERFDQTIGETPMKKPLFETTNPNGGFQTNQNTGFQTGASNQSNVFYNSSTSQPQRNGFGNNTIESNVPSNVSGQFSSQNSGVERGSGFGFNRPPQNTAANSNFSNQAPFSQDRRHTPPSTNGGGFFGSGFGQPTSQTQTQTQNSRQRYQQPQQSGFSHQQPVQPTVTTGQNGWPEINTTINTKDLIQRGAETTAEMLRRAYESNVQSR